MSDSDKPTKLLVLIHEMEARIRLKALPSATLGSLEASILQ